MMPWARLYLMGLCLAVTAGSARAQTFGVPTFAGGALGRVAAAGAAQTVFRVNSGTGAVTVISGSAVRISTGSANVTVTVSCGNQNGCNTNRPQVSIASAGAPTGRAAALGNFTVTAGTATIFAGPTGTNPVNLTLNAIGRNQSRTFTLGFDFPINTTGTTGNATSGFTVAISRNNGSQTRTGTGSATATVFRGIDITKSSDLVFGKVVRPSSGSGTVNVGAAGARTVIGTGSFAFAAPAPAAAQFNVTGEGGQSVTVSVPASFQMSNGGNPPLTVTTTATGSGTQNLGGTIGNAGTLPVAVGGSFPLTSSTATGLYSGSFTVTVQYN